MSEKYAPNPPGAPVPPGMAPSAEIIAAPPGIKDDNNKKDDRGEIPHSMNLYERNLYIQIFLVGVTAVIAALNVSYNFEIVRLYEELEDATNAIAQLPDPVDKDALLEEFNNLTAADGDKTFCDIPFFVEQENSDYITSSISNVTKIVKAATYMAAGFFVWLHILFKILSAYTLVYSNFRIGVIEEDTDQAEEADQGYGRMSSRPKAPALIATAGNQGSNVLLENEDEKKIRVFLRGETMLFSFLQFFDDIPIATASIFYIFFQNGSRGSKCLAEYKVGIVGSVDAVDNIDEAIFLQIGFILLSVIWNISNLAMRWIKFFAHTTKKYSRSSNSPVVRGFKATAWCIGYIFVILTPTFIIIYSDIGAEVFGFEAAGQIQYLVLVAIGGVSTLAFLLFFCCFWGASYLGDGFCVICIVFEGFLIGGEFCELGVCELLCDAC